MAFKPNDPNAKDAEYDATDLVRRLALLNNRMFPAQDGIHPVAAYTSIGTLVKKYEQADFMEIAPLLPDVLMLEELVVKQWETVNGQKRGGAEKLGVISKASGNSTERSCLRPDEKRSDSARANPGRLSRGDDDLHAGSRRRSPKVRLRRASRVAAREMAARLRGLRVPPRPPPR